MDGQRFQQGAEDAGHALFSPGTTRIKLTAGFMQGAKSCMIAFQVRKALCPCLFGVNETLQRVLLFFPLLCFLIKKFCSLIL